MKTLCTILIIVLAVCLQAQWSNDPNNNLIIGYGLNPELCSDSAGGCYITYEAGYPSELYLHRINKYGYQPWGDKRIIAGELDEQNSAKIIEDGEGGVIVSYGEHNLLNSYRLRVQKVDSNGNFMWGPTGVKVSITDTRQSVQRLVTDGDGGCVIVWIDTLAEYKINRINRFGQRVWSDSGKVIAIDEYYHKPQLVRSSDGNYYVSILEFLYKIDFGGQIVRKDTVTLGNMVPDTEGGIILSRRVWTGMIPKLVAQRIDSLGNNLWQEPYVEIADSLYINAIINVKRINSYYYYTWHGRKNGIDLVAQYQALRSNGTKLFDQYNLPISNYPVDALLGNILPSESGTFVLIWQDYRPDDGVFGQRRDTLGSPLWNLNDVSIYTGTYSELYAITDCAGGAIGLGWHQFDFSLRAFKVSKNGILGEIITSVNSEKNEVTLEGFLLFQNYPNPFNPSTKIKYTIPTPPSSSPLLKGRNEVGFVSLKVYDVLGNEVATLVNEEKQPGVYEVEFGNVGTSRDLSVTSGIYFYQLKIGNLVETKKMIFLK